MNVHVICRNYKDDRVIPRMSRYLRDLNGWTVGKEPNPKADANYHCGYFEWLLWRGFRDTPLAAYLTHREENAREKARAWDTVCSVVDLRIVTCRKYGVIAEKHGMTVQVPLPVERDRFTPADSLPKHLTIGTSGFTYNTGRKGGDMVRKLAAALQKRATFKASGRGWPVPTKRHDWKNMPDFYRSLSIWFCSSTVEGGPMGTVEALSCGVPVVIPAGVGIHDELPAMKGIYRYPKGNYDGLLAAMKRAIDELPTIDRAALRCATEPYNPQAWADVHRDAFEDLMAPRVAPIEELPDWRGNCGIYYVAFGPPARKAARTSIRGAKKYMPDVPVAVVSDKPLNCGEDVFIQQPDRDVGGRIAKLSAYDVAPRQWHYVLYIDADTEIIGDATYFFQLLADGWEFVITKDPHKHDLLKHMYRSGQDAEHFETLNATGTSEALALNGGVWAFRRNDRVQDFFKRWRREWDRHGQRDQPGLIRALYKNPLRMFVLGSEWNLFPKYKAREKAACILHFPMRARRWRGRLGSGVRLDSKQAWQQANSWLKSQRK